METAQERRVTGDPNNAEVRERKRERKEQILIRDIGLRHTHYC